MTLCPAIRRIAHNMWPFRKRPTPPTGPLTVRHIIVPQSALAPAAKDYELTMAIWELQDVMTQNHVIQDQLADEVQLVCNVDYYVGQVQNGGHSQYIANSGVDFALFERVEKALSLMGAKRLLALHQKMHKWCRENPEAAAEQDGFEHRGDLLDPLDTALYALSDTKHSSYAKTNAWLKNLPHLYPLPDDGWQDRVAALARQQPDYVANKEVAAIKSIGLQMNDPFMVALRMIGQATDPVTEVYHQTAGSMVGHPSGEGGIVWALNTNRDILAGYEDGPDVCLAEWGDRTFKSIKATLGRINKQDVAARIDTLWDQNVPMSLYLLCREAHFQPDTCYFVPADNGTMRVQSDGKTYQHIQDNHHTLRDMETGVEVASIAAADVSRLSDILATQSAAAFWQAAAAPPLTNTNIPDQPAP